MTSIRPELLNNQLDALDRLFDGEAGIADVCALAYATAVALRGDHLVPVLESAANELSALQRKSLSVEDARAAALTATDHLRVTLAEALPSPQAAKRGWTGRGHERPVTHDGFRVGELAATGAASNFIAPWQIRN
ncbi:MAG TPA: hypothetical protein VIN06_03890 [Devosia sp.]